MNLPIHLSEQDLELHLVEGTTTCALCILIDMSGSMVRYGRFVAAKKVAMALSALVGQRFPQDTVDIVGFYSTANRVRQEQLPLLMPKPVSTYEYEINISVPLDQADADASYHLHQFAVGHADGATYSALACCRAKVNVRYYRWPTYCSC